MKQILQSLRSGSINVNEIPAPKVKEGYVLIKTSKTLISSGTERSLIEFGKSNYFKKALSQPEKVKEVLYKVKNEGFSETYKAISNKLDTPTPIGYCNVGTVIKVGKGVKNFQIGDKVVSNGYHSEIVSVPKNLCAKIPKDISDEDAVFSILGAISLQGIRLANTNLGETVAVIGLGLIGLLTVEILKASGCHVIAIDIDEKKVKIARSLGVHSIKLSKTNTAVSTVDKITNGVGVDAAIISSSSSNNDPIELASKLCRKRGSVVLIGVADLKLNRNIFYGKELNFQVSCSYGPGRYDKNYEEKGIDYPIGYVRWTENRNILAIIKLIKDKKIEVEKFKSKTFHIEDAKQAYEYMLKNRNALGIIINFGNEVRSHENYENIVLSKTSEVKKINIGFFGAGNYSKVLLNEIKKSDVNLVTIVSDQGITGTQAGKKFNFENSTTSDKLIYQNKKINLVFICTQHQTHADLTLQNLNAGKNVFVEKPLALTVTDLNLIKKSLLKNKKKLFIGYNRRFSKFSKKIKNLISEYEVPKALIINVNAGEIPLDSWIHDKEIGGGRLIGEACHFIDYSRFIVGKKIIDFSKTSLSSKTNDTFIINLTFEDGSVAVINYFANGHKSIPKERVEIFMDGKILILENFRKLKGYGWPNFKRMASFNQDKGQKSMIYEILHTLEKGGEPLIPYEEIFEVSKIAIELENQ